MRHLLIAFCCLALLSGCTGRPVSTPGGDQVSKASQLVEITNPHDWLPEGTKPIAIPITKDQEVLNVAVPGTAVDIVGEIGEPTKSDNLVANVILLAVDSQDTIQDALNEITVVVALTTAQLADLTLMREQETKLSIRLHVKDTPKQ